MSKPSKPNTELILQEAIRDKQSAVDALGEATKRSEEIASLRIEPLALPRTEAVLSYLPQAVSSLAQEEGKLDLLIANAQKVQSSLHAFEGVERQCESILYESHLLLEAGHYGEAAKTIAELNEYLDLDYGVTLRFEELVREIRDWSLVKIALSDQFDRLKNGKESLSKDVLFALKEDAKKLPTLYHKEEAKREFLDQAFYVLGRYFLSQGEAESVEDLSERFLEINDFESLESPSPKTQEIYDELKEKSIRSFLEFSHLLEAKNAKYDEALSLFRLRASIPSDQEVPSLFSLPKDEKEFRLFFLRNVCLSQDEEEFNQYLLSLRSSLEFENPESSALVAMLLASPEIGEKKGNALLGLFGVLTFERKIDVFARVLLQNPSHETLSALFMALKDSEKKSLDLERKAEELLTISQNLPEEFAKDGKELIASLLRSPLARKTVLKSASPSLHALAGHKEKFPIPVGKKAKDTYANSWGETRYLCFIFFAAILPLCLLAGSVTYLVAYQNESPFYPFYLLIPLTLLIGLTIALTVTFAGNDERPSAIVRRILGFFGLLCALGSCFYYLIPAFSFFQPYEYTLMIGGVIFLLMSQFLLKDFRKWWNFVIPLPLALLELIDLILLILRLMNRL